MLKRFARRSFTALALTLLRAACVSAGDPAAPPAVAAGEVGADAGTFRSLNENFGVDARRVYTRSSQMGDYGPLKPEHIVLGADVRSFVALNGVYGKDRAHAYFANRLMPGADAATFRVLSNGFARDKKRVFCNANPVQGADVETFAVISGTYGKDQARVFNCTQAIEGASPSNFHFLSASTSFAADDRFVYYMGIAIPGSDGPSVRPKLSLVGLIGLPSYRDKSHTYSVQGQTGALQIDGVLSLDWRKKFSGN